MEQLKTAYPQAEIQLWCEDEHRLGLKPVIRHIYVPEGESPIANDNWQFKWLWLYAFVHPKTGETDWWILPYINTELFNRVLADFAREFDLSSDKHILLAVDQAGWHTSNDLEVPNGLHLILLPPHSPELQPAERLWTIVDEPIANQSFEMLADLEEVLFRRCQTLLQQQDLIRGLTRYHWWNQIGA